MTDLRNELREPYADALRRFVPGARQLIDDITAHIQASIAAYGPTPSGRRRRLIEMAAEAAVTAFFELAHDPSSGSRKVDQLFRQMGHGEARDNNKLTAMQSALRLAHDDAWAYLRTEARPMGLSAAALMALEDALGGFMNHLAEQVELGHTEARRVLDQEPGFVQRTLVEHITNGAPDEEIRWYSVKASWALPERCVVAVVQHDADFAPQVPQTAIAAHDQVESIVICPESDAKQLFETWLWSASDEDGPRAAVSWAVPLSDAQDALRWARRALSLVGPGVIPQQPVIDCDEHRTQIWLHAEPSIRRELCQELLKPLLAETPNSRAILSETLLLWLGTRGSPKALAPMLGVSVSTVRYRWKRINDLFGEELYNPEFVIPVTMILQASVPLWNAGDQSDFELFRSGESR